MILDTTFVIDFLNGKMDAVAKMEWILDENMDHAITAPTIFELWSGIISLGKGEKEKIKTKDFLNSQIIYSLSNESAEKSGKIHGELVKKGLTIDPEDCMIAGIALTNHKKVLTRDEHFRRIEGLSLVDY